MQEKETLGKAMSSVMPTSQSSENTEERRSSPREKLKGCVVLVFFGEDNWGKLTNMSESGMAFEFAKPPSLQERVTFTFQAMGGMPPPRNGKAPGDSFEAPGKIVWTREFERGAGVQFVDLEEGSREQIRQWLSLETSQNPSPRAKPPKPEVQPIPAELVSPFAQESDTQSAAANKLESILELDMPVPLAEQVPDLDSAFSESPVGERSYETPAWAGQKQADKGSPSPESATHVHPSVARLTFLVVAGCLAAFAITAGTRIFMTWEARRADAAVRGTDSGPGMNDSSAETNVPSPSPTPVSSPSALVTSSPAASAPPFQVDVLDADGRNWILWFVRGEAKGSDSQPPSRAAETANSAAARVTTTRRQEASPPQKPPETHTFTMAAPNLSHPPDTGITGKPSAEVPAIQPGLAVASGDPFVGALGHQMAPAAPAVHAPTGGMVQQPRLIRAGIPVYPQLAKSSRLSGDVVVDALIDAAGKVTTVKVISGPVLLQQAAMDTVRRWEYEPARLDGQPVAMHLSVTVKFRLN